MNPYIYTFIRNDLPHEQKIVQLGHATYEAGQKFEKPSEVASLILMQAKDEIDLITVADQLNEENIPHIIFYEPDIDECTAICTCPIIGKERNFFKKFNLYKESTPCKF